MDTLGTEVGQKMRCAVKAKLIELGTGSGYIDDELPDYVMIMVANKRSKKQMRDDLQLFLNENTEPFVNWLHQVLDKLQEVTLPTSVTQKATGKSSADVKKDKKNKKAKRSTKDQSPPPKSSSSSSLDKQAQAPSITDVFANQLIGKAKRNLEVESQAPVKKQESRKEVQSNEFNIPSVTDMVKNAVLNSKRKELEELEQIQKQIEEAKRQLKILPGDDSRKSSPEPQEEDDDFLNLKADELDDEDNDSQSKEMEKETTSTSSNNNQAHGQRSRSPIVFNRDGHRASRHSPEKSSKEPTDKNQGELSKGPAKSRLGAINSVSQVPDKSKGENIISLSAHRQMERELYTPVHRRKEEPTIAVTTSRQSRNSSSDRDSRLRHRQTDLPRNRRSGSGVATERERHTVHRQRSPHRRERSSPLREQRRPFRERERSRATPPPPTVSSRATRIEVTRTVKEMDPATERLSVRQRIGSRVIVAPPKQVEEEEEVDVPVNSVVTIKPRPVVAKNRQANKNLLLRAMADAQKSMVGITAKQPLDTPVLQQTAVVAPTLRLGKKITDTGVSVKGRLGVTVASKRQRSQINAIVSSLDPVLKRQRPNEKIIIEIGPNDGYSDSDLEEDRDEEQASLEEVIGVLKQGNGISKADFEYVPKPLDVLRRNNEATVMVEEIDAEVEEEEITGKDEAASNTQFVVTLDGAFNKNKKPNAVGLRKRVDLNHPAFKKVVPAVKNIEGVRSRISSRLGVVGAEDVTNKSTIGRREDVSAKLSPRPVVDLRQRVQEKRNGSPGLKRLVEPTKTSPSSLNSRKRRSPINFSAKDNKAEERDKKSNEEAASELPQRKRIRITNSPPPAKKVEEDKSTAAETSGDENKKTKSTIVVVSKEKEKRDPKKYDNIPPLLSSVAVPAINSNMGKVLERCKFFPNCTRGDACEFVHPSTNCKAFPNCKFGESCLYIHPKCKFDLACVRPDCNFSHTPVSSATPISSHVVPVHNYKSISVNPLPAICRFYPNCTNHLCTFYHPKMCFNGPNCPNKLECNFYHHELPAAKFKWVSPMTG